MNNFLQRLKDGNNKKTIENLVIFLVLAIIVIIVVNTLFRENENMVKPQAIEVSKIDNQTDDLEEKLEKILSLIDGAGKVEVMISYVTGVEQVPLYDERENMTVTEEKDKEGGTRKTEQTSNEKNVIYEEKSSTKSPVIKQSIMPQVMGVIVVAEGANNLNTKNNIIKAVEATVDVPTHRIQVFAKKI